MPARIAIVPGVDGGVMALLHANSEGTVGVSIRGNEAIHVSERALPLLQLYLVVEGGRGVLLIEVEGAVLDYDGAVGRCSYRRCVDAARRARPSRVLVYPEGCHHIGRARKGQALY